MAVGQRLRGWNAVLVVVVLGCLVANQTRANLLAAVLLFLVLLRPVRAGENPGRTRMAFGAAILVILVAPFFAESRLSGQSSADRLSTQGHLQEWETGWRQIQAKPLGTGLGTAPGVGDRYTSQAVISDNSYLQVGAELGVFTMVLFVTLLGATLRKLASEPSQLGRAMFAVGCGLAFAGMFHHVWITYALPWAFWGGAALCLPGRRRQALGLEPVSSFGSIDDTHP
jgi:O-antigen ligase